MIMLAPVSSRSAIMGFLLLAYTFVPYQPTSSRVHGFGTTVLTSSIAYICPSPPRFMSPVSLSVVTDYDGAALVCVLSSLAPPVCTHLSRRRTLACFCPVMRPSSSRLLSSV